MSSHDIEIYPTNSLEENCIEVELPTGRNYYVDLRQTYLALILKFVKGRGYETYKTKEKEKEHKKEAKADEERTAAQEEQDAPVPFATHVNNILHSIFSNVERYINNQQTYKSIGLYAHKCYLSNNFKEATFEFKEVLPCEEHDYENFLDEILEAPSSERFFTRRMKMLSGADGFMLYDKLSVDFFSTSEWLYPKMKVRLWLIRARPEFFRISDNPNQR